MAEYNNYYVMKSSPGFSLVEVTLALGLVSFSMVGLVGMLPVGLSNARAAMEVQTQARITQRIAAELQLTPFLTISDGSYQSNFPRFYNEEGSPAASAEGIYTVTAAPPGQLELPGGQSNTNVLLLTFGIQKKTAPGVAEAFSLIASNTGQ
jgi:uncharacterized protein (TIGR02598 family)